MASKSFKSHSTSHLSVACRFYPEAIPFRSYIDQINALVEPRSRIELALDGDRKDSVQRAYARLIDRLIVAFPSDGTPKFPTNAIDSLHSAKTVSLHQILTNVITTTLRSHPPSIAAQRNVLCTGFSLAYEDGPGSIFCDLDARSPSAPVQTILTPTWCLLLLRVGQVVLVHLLTHCVLLLAVENNPETLQSSRAKFSSTFLQICGPLVGGTYLSTGNCKPRSSNIVLKRDILHRTPRYRSKGIVARVFNGLSHHFWNDGLPKMHHLRYVSASTAPVPFLQSLIFAEHKVLKACSETLAKSFDTSNSEIGIPRVRDYDSLSIKLFDTFRDSACLKQYKTLRKSLPNRLNKINPLLHRLLTGIQKRSFRRTLGISCPLPKVIRQPISKRGYLPTQTLIEMNTRPKYVARFLVSCCRQVLPKELFGSLQNKHLFENAVHDFVCHRQLKESFDICRYFAEKPFKVTDMTWLYTLKGNKKRVVSPTDLRFRQSRMNNLLIWIFRGFLIPALQQSFYVTEGNLHKNKVFFFRREIWTELIDAANKMVLRSNGQFSILSRAELVWRTQQRDSVVSQLGSRWCPFPILMYHDIRYLPKRSSVRGIQRRRARMLIGFSSISRMGIEKTRVQKGLSRRSFEMGQRMLRSMMNSILNVLLAESRSRPTCLGASVFSLDEIYEKWLTLKQKWKVEGQPKMFACCVDVEKSFDTIPLKTLLEDVVFRLLTKSRYPIVKTRVCKRDALSGRIMSRMLTHVCLQGGDETSFLRLVRERLSSRHSGGIFTDAANVSTLSREEMVIALREFITNNLVTVPRRCREDGETGFAVQRQGVAQGHPLSPLLTSLFYGHVERSDLREFFNDNGNDSKEAAQVSLLMRMVDDTFFISCCRMQSIQFLKRMVLGWKGSYGFSVNGEKTRASFANDVGGHEHVRNMPWCGLLVNMDTLEVSCDYSRYRNYGSRMRHCVTVEHDSKLGSAWEGRATVCFKPKIHGLLLDGRINSERTVALNVYQAAVLCCLKVCAYMLCLDNIHNSKFATNVLQTTMSKFTWIVIRASRKHPGCTMALSALQVSFLTRHAFHTAMTKRMTGRRGRDRRCKAVFQSCMANVAKSLNETEHLFLNQDNKTHLINMATSLAQNHCSDLWRLEL